MPTAEELWAMGDVNRDGIIDQKDLDAITAAWRTKPGDPNWNPDADVNSDGVVDIYDSGLVNANLGEKLSAGEWPWPFNGVQDWFEGLLGNIVGSLRPIIDAVKDTLLPVLEGVSNAVWNALPEWIRSGLLFLGDLAGQAWTVLWDFVRDPIGSMQAGLDWVVSTVGDTLAGISTAVGALVADVWAALPDWVRGPLEFLRDLAGQAWAALWDFIHDPIGSLQAGFNWVATTVTSAFDGALSTFGGWITDAMAAVAGALGSALQGLVNWLGTEIPKAISVVAQFAQAYIVDPIVGALQWVFNRLGDIVHSLISTVEGMFAHHSPIKPEDALSIGIMAAVAAVASGGLATGLLDILSTRIVATGLDLKGLANYITQMINPGMFMGAVVGVLVGTGIRVPLTQYYNKLFRPRIPAIEEGQRMLWRGKISMDQFRDIVARSGFGAPYEEGYMELTKMIPPAPDLIRMVVREAFLPEMVVEAPPVFAEYMEKQGFAREWSDRLWTAHFIPIDLRQAYENLWRGYWTKEEFMFALHIADVHPRWREDIYNVAFRPPGVREMGYGYDTGMYSVEDIVKYRRWGGLAPEDAEKAGRAMVAYRTEAEREGLRREALADYVAGLDTEAELRTKLADIGGRDEIIDLWVARAVYRRTRDLKTDLIKVCVNDFVKGRIDRTTLEQDLIELDVVPETRSVLIREAETRRAKTIREDVAEKKKLIPVARVRKARDLGLIGDAEYIGRLVDHDYTEEDARLDLSIELTPRPVTPEELERRRRTVEARLNRASRVWERRIAGVDAHVSLAALQIEDAELVMKESLDVLDAQISIIDEDLPVVSPERADVLRKRRVVLVQRREAMEARFTKRIRELTERHKALVEEKGLLEKQRDEELGEYEEELNLLGAPAS